MNNKIYPTPYEIKEVLNSFAKRSAVNKFAQSRGIVLVNARHEDISAEISNLLFDKEDIDALRLLAYQAVSKHTLSGFTIQTKDHAFRLENLYNGIREKGELEQHGYLLKSLSKISENGTERYKGAIEYKKKKPGRIQFIDEETEYCEFSFFELSKGEWQIEIDGNNSSDGKEVFKLISRAINNKETSILNIIIDPLENKGTIDFFDKLGKGGMGESWRLTNVTQLTLKRSRNENDENDDNDENDSDDTNEEVDDKEQLTGIRQAILDGRNLREDPFVTKYESSGGCLFTAMTYEFEGIKTPDIIQIRAEFKGSPKIFEVSIVSSFTRVGTTAKRESKELNTDEHIQYRSAFWNNAKEIYKQIVELH
jgi:hypothetical protein